jgi:hypothetical protein
MVDKSSYLVKALGLWNSVASSLHSIYPNPLFSPPIKRVPYKLVPIGMGVSLSMEILSIAFLFANVKDSNNVFKAGSLTAQTT